MSLASDLEAIAGFLLVFIIPGFCLAKAVFPEWRFRGPSGLRRVVELGTLSFVLSVVLTVLVGYVLLSFAPGGFQAYWSDPVLETILAAISAVALVFAWVRGSFRRMPLVPTAPPTPSEEGAWELTRDLDRLGREERRLRHRLRVGVEDPTERDRMNNRLEEIRQECEELARRREAQYAQ